MIKTVKVGELSNYFKKCLDRFGTLDESFIPTFNFMSKFPVTAVLFLFIYLFSTIFNEIKIKKEA
jgi:hypothetical protein